MNTATIRVLEPLAEEIAGLKSSASTGAVNLSRYQFRLDKRGLSAVHLGAIARVYADHGDDMLKLLKKNPMGAIPVCLRRLQEKVSLPSFENMSPKHAYTPFLIHFLLFYSLPSTVSA